MAVSLTDIARQLGVAPSTISRAMSAPDKVAPKTRERILKHIEKAGYRPNISARNLRTKRSNTIGIVVNDLCDSLIAQTANIMQDIAFQRGYFPILLSTVESTEKEQETISRLLMLNLTGLVIIPTSNTASLLDKLQGIPVVELDRSTDTNLNDEFRMDDVAAMQMATRYLIEQGCKHIAVVFGNVDRVSSFKYRHVGLMQSSQEVNYSSFFIEDVSTQGLIDSAKMLTDYILTAQNSGAMKGKKEILKKMKEELTPHLLPISSDLNKLDPKMPIDGILSVNHSLCAGVLQGFYKHDHLKINEDIKLFTFDNPDWIKLMPFAIPTITHPLDKAAELAINRLIDRIEGNYSEAVEARLIRPQLIPEPGTTINE